MVRRLGGPIVLACAAAIAAVGAPPQAEVPRAVRYTVQPVPPTQTAPAHTRVRIVAPVLVGSETVRFRMPVWTPGDYSVQNHGRYVRAVRSSSSAVRRPDANTWEVAATGSDSVQIEYELPNVPPGSFSENALVTQSHAFLSGPATLMYLAGATNRPTEIRVRRPEGWSEPVTPLDPLEDGGFAAPDYDRLADAPLLVGEHTLRRFDALGKPHRVAFFGAKRGVDEEGLTALFGRVVRGAGEYMGSLPYKQYVLFIDVDGRGGGLEHGASARIAWSRGGPSQQFARFAAHEFMHLWNVKRIRPASLAPIRYDTPPRIGSLWFLEGVTEYVAGAVCARAGLLSEAERLEGLARCIDELRATPARLEVTAEEAGLRVWESGDSAGFGGLSYYLKGELIGMCLDMRIIAESNGRHSMLTVMRDLMERYSPPRAGYTDEELRDAFVRAGGANVGPLYDLLVGTTREMPFEECLSGLGLRLGPNAVGRTVIRRSYDATARSDRLRRTWLTGS